MCNLYRMTKSPAEVAQWFDAEDRSAGANLSELIYPGYPGLVVARGRLGAMVWGFPLARKGKDGAPLKPKPVNNARADKLGSFFWRDSFEKRRCLIPLTAWAEAEGPSGAKRRSWLAVEGEELFAAAGIWRKSDEWGACYSMVMTDASGRAAELHSRMPVIVERKDYARWCDGTPGEARALCRPFDGPLTIERTKDPWVHRRRHGDHHA